MRCSRRLCGAALVHIRASTDVTVVFYDSVTASQSPVDCLISVIAARYRIGTLLLYTVNPGKVAGDVIWHERG